MLFLVAFCGMQAQLTTKTTAHGSKPGYIDKATLVVQPHGAYVEQALYLSYGDHGAFGSNPNVEIVHRFRLPANAVVNDLWLWIGDSVMQAIMLDVWKARAIYDSITSSLHDPAFLAKKGDVYELHIFPLISGRVRRIRMNFLVPARYVGSTGSAELPLGMLLDNNAAVKPLEVMFRTVDRSWGTPTISEVPSLVFDTLPDTRGYKFLVTNIPDVTPLKSMTMSFRAALDEGTRLTSASVKKTEQSWFEYGFDPTAIFSPPADTSMKKRLFALDLSGLHDRQYSTFLPELREFLTSATNPRDSIALLVSGAGRVSRARAGWIPTRPSAIDSLVTQFAAGVHGAEIAAQQLPLVEYCDVNSTICWQFPGIENVARVHVSKDIHNALRVPSSDVIASYEHRGSADSLKILLPALLERGGRVVWYIDENHDPRMEEPLLPSVKFTKVYSDAVVPLFRKENGNLGAAFPEVVDHLSRGFITYDTGYGITAELVDTAGRAQVISRRIGSGLIVLSCLWSFRADGALRATVGVPLLGLNSAARGVTMLTTLLSEVRRVHEEEGSDHIYVLSNTDTVYSVQVSSSMAMQYAAEFHRPLPRFTTLNLLRAAAYTPPFITDAGVRYYGSGMLLRSVADALGGRYIAASEYTWPRVCEMVTPSGFADIDSMRLEVAVLGGGGELRVLREVDHVPGDFRKVRYFFGETSAADSLRFTATARLANDPQPRVHQRTVQLTKDSARMNWTIPPMLANEQLRDMFAKKPPLDTAGIVALARKNRLLCDFTAFLALEPNDTLKFMRDPFDETKLTDVLPIEFSSDGDSLAVVVTPNPFRGSTRIAVRAPEGSEVTITLFDMLGRAVRTVSSSPQTSRMQVYTWNGADAQNSPLPAGIYFVHVLARSPFHDAPLSVVRRVVRME
ncbi:MAG: T9SS type A sorting domain-containing protein [Ignavibacteriae bacterium]|nr:T9SS type A sorting domain-containing protein [Ignavibacteriota bacterium]